jgi:O-methyltransferase involved in polyketide biosynthesis
MASSRHDGDTWDLASSVGATATMAAAARAMATRADPSLIDDRFTDEFFRAAGLPQAVARRRTGCSTPSPDSARRTAG